MKPPSEDPAVKLSFSLPTSLSKRMLERMKALGITSVSQYVQTLVHNDTATSGPFVRSATEVTRRALE